MRTKSQNHVVHHVERLFVDGFQHGFGVGNYVVELRLFLHTYFSFLCLAVAGFVLLADGAYSRNAFASRPKGRN